jgi:hypothetical protein
MLFRGRFLRVFVAHASTPCGLFVFSRLAPNTHPQHPNTPTPTHSQHPTPHPNQPHPRINNAGTNAYKYGPLTESDDDDLSAIVETNVLGVMLCCKEVGWAAWGGVVRFCGGGGVLLCCRDVGPARAVRPVSFLAVHSL